MDIFRYLLCLIFSDRSMYMQMKTNTFQELFSKNTVYRFLNNIKTNGYRFTTLLSAADDKNLLCGADHYDGRSLAGKRRSLSRRKATDVIIDLIRSAQTAGISAKYVLFDSWFSSPKSVLTIKRGCQLDTIAMIKKSGKIKYG